MKKFATTLGVAALSTLSLLSFSANAEAADLALRSDLLTKFTTSFVQTEGLAFDELALPKLDASQLYWDQGVDDVEIFFINEGAGYKNQLFFSANDGPMTKIFDNISSTMSTRPEKNGVLTLGEGRKLKSFSGPTQLAFFLKSDGFNGGNNFFGADSYTGMTIDGQKINQDDVSHLIAYNYFDEVSKENYTILGFEDLWGSEADGSDRDFNDVVFAVKGLTTKADLPAETPEPSALLGLVGLAAVVGSRRLKQSAAA
ncbi:MAG: DUF4114 domain-containing protein [Phormidesmis sp.]